MAEVRHFFVNLGQGIIDRINGIMGCNYVKGKFYPDGICIAIRGWPIYVSRTFLHQAVCQQRWQHRQRRSVLCNRALEIHRALEFRKECSIRLYLKS